MFSVLYNYNVFYIVMRVHKRFLKEALRFLPEQKQPSLVCFNCSMPASFCFGKSSSRFAECLLTEITDAIDYLDRFAEIVSIDIDFAIPLPPSNFIFVVVPIVVSLAVMLLEVLPLCDLNRLLPMMVLSLTLSTTSAFLRVPAQASYPYVIPFLHWCTYQNPLFVAASAIDRHRRCPPRSQSL